MAQSSNARKVGLFVALALIVIAVLILNFSKGRGLFTSSYRVTIIAQSIGGLKPGAAVSMSGVPIGSVVSVELTADRKAVAVTCRIEKRYEIHKDAKFDIETSGFLGDQYVSIAPTENKAPTLQDGDTVLAQSPFNLQEAARSAMHLMSKLDTAVDRINGAIGRVDTMLLSETNLNNLSASVANIREMSERAKQATGRLDLLIETNAPGVALALSNLNALAISLQGVATNLDAVVQRADPSLQSALREATAATADLRVVTGEIREGRGLVGALLKDEGVRGNFSLTISNLSVVSSNLAKFGLLYKPKQVRSVTNTTGHVGRSPFR
jgi:phospholipid/cholesterol/gamma-HCH transport system substrate-binding protein